MGDSGEASSGAAHGLQEDGGRQRSALRWLRALAGGSELSVESEPAKVIPAGNGTTGGIANLTRLRVEDVMIPKVEIVAVPENIGKGRLVKVFHDSGLTRLPVFKDTLDEPLGIVHLKDFALKHGFNGSDDRFVLGRMLRPLLYAPHSMPIGVLLQKMQTDRVHMALVIDEYGGVDGLVTIEDLIEQVIGEIEDEHDVGEGALWVREAAGSFLAYARAPLDEFEQEVGRRLRTGEGDEEVDTLGGLVFMLAGRVPSRGEVVEHPHGTDFEVVDADPRRIKRLRIRLGVPKAVE